MLRGEAIQALMCQGEIDIERLEERFDIDFDAYFAAALAKLKPLQADGLVNVKPGRITATSRGRLLLRIIAGCFDRYLDQPVLKEMRPRYSRVV